MYHISIYFDEKTAAYMQKLMEKVAQVTGNHYMSEANVPPHITLCALECADEEALKACLESTFGKRGDAQTGTRENSTLQWVSVGTFLPGVIFLQPVLNEYLQGLMEQVHRCVLASAETVRGSVLALAEAVRGCVLASAEAVRGCVLASAETVQGSVQGTYGQAREPGGIKIKPCYRPFSWLPHSTIAKKLTPKELQAAFGVLQKEFTVFEGQVVRMGLAKMNPHRELASWEI